MIPVTEKQIAKIKISHDLNKVYIGFLNRVTESDEAEDPESSTTVNDYTIKAKHRPHKDFVDSMKKLRKFALEVCEMKVDKTELSDWTVFEIKITGDLTMRTSRVVMSLSKKVHKTGKHIEIKNCPQITMYPEKDQDDRYANAEKMSEIIEDVVEEAWSYLNGKFELDNNPQLALFATGPVAQTA